MKRDDVTSEFKNIRGRHSNMIYCNLGEYRQPISLISSTKQKERSQFALELCSFIASGNKHDGTKEDYILLLTKYFKSYPGIFDTIAENLNKSIYCPLNASQSVQLHSLLRLTTFKFRLLRVFFNNLNIKLFASERKMRVFRDQLLSYVK